MKKILIALGIVLTLILFIIGGFHLLAYSMYKHTDCNRFNIDNIELRTGINIPAIIDSECENEDNTKHAVFTLNTAELELKEYLKKNHFTFDGETQTYINSGESKDTRWEASFDGQTDKLKLDITYK